MASPYLNLASAPLLLMSSGYEIWSRLAEHSVGVRHGVLLFSLIQIFKTLPDIAENLEKMRKVHEDLSVVQHSHEHDDLSNG